MHRAPDLTLVMPDHGFISVLKAEEPCTRRPWVVGTHRPEGIFIASGSGIRKGLALSHGLSILDVTPALLYSLNLPIPEDFEGAFVSDIFESSFTKATPPRIDAPTRRPESRRTAESDAALEAEEEARIYERLKALGYVE